MIVLVLLKHVETVDFIIVEHVDNFQVRSYMFIIPMLNSSILSLENNYHTHAAVGSLSMASNHYAQCQGFLRNPCIDLSTTEDVDSQHPEGEAPPSERHQGDA